MFREDLTRRSSFWNAATHFKIQQMCIYCFVFALKEFIFLGLCKRFSSGPSRSDRTRSVAPQSVLHEPPDGRIYLISFKYDIISLVLYYENRSPCFSHLALEFTEHVWPTIFHSDLGECNNSDDSDLLYKVTVRGAGQGTIFLDRLLICHSYCCGYCMTVHVLSSSCPLTFIFHLIPFFLRVNSIKILPLCLFERKLPGMKMHLLEQPC